MAKRLVICCDGTWNVRDRMDRGKACPSNVAKMAPAVAPRDLDEIQQPIFYDKGVGTGVWDRVRGGAFGWGLSKHVRDAYRFIVEQYEPVDETFLFGCSRGAYTARSTAGLIRNSGVLRPEHEDKVIHAYNLYRRRDDASHPAAVEAELFRKAFAREVRIKFIGVWDTVGALGIPVGIPWLPATWLHFLNQRWEFHDVRLSTFVGNAYHGSPSTGGRSSPPPSGSSSPTRRVSGWSRSGLPGCIPTSEAGIGTAGSRTWRSCG